ncbi:PTS fructose transporter subunit IIB [Endozoicomonas arenosclerae]|uniref:PTS fructose transporter subunit IIB n=1 Tax=Endozoicomonas arenosclerae TaxID=1633495 RepID=UPI000785E390|nr:fructose PTS transporter subunit IIB [Endozoicomonas arenosclerae]
MNIIAVTACSTGIAETYMAAEVLERCARTRGHSIKVETQGALGILDALSSQDIESADIAILTNDIAINGNDRFTGLKTFHVSIDDILESPQDIILAIHSES